MTRLTQWTPYGASLILDDPQNEEEAKKQLMDKYKLAINKLAKYEDRDDYHMLYGTTEIYDK